MRRALNPPDQAAFFLKEDQIQSAIIESRKSPRRRIILPVQRSESDPVQRLINIIQPGSYVQPHLHPRPQAIELVIVLRGRLRVVLFDEKGTVAKRVDLRTGGDPVLMDIVPGVWHTMIALEPDTVVLEVKGGPYDPDQDKVFAQWAPGEGMPGTDDYLRTLLEEAEGR